MKPVKLSSFLGMNNRLPAERLRVKDGSFVVAAVNGDFTDAGTFRRRAGFAPVLGGAAAHSFWSNGKEAYMVDGSSLYYVVKDNLGAIVRTAIATVTPGRQFSYAAAAGFSYATNGIEFFRLSAGTAIPVGVPAPSAPILVAGTSGSLPKGIYIFALSFRTDDGRDSGISDVTRIEIFADNGSIELPLLPALPGAATILYMTPTNGDDLFEVGEVSLTHTITVVPPEGARPVAVLTQPLPAGHFVRYLKGRLFTADDTTVFFSLPYALELYDASSDSFQFPAPITLLEPCINGLYIAADKTYWLDIDSMKMVEVLPYGAVLGTGNFRKDEEQVWWMSARGMCVGDQNGQVTNTQEDALALSPAQFGATLFREEDGLKQMVASTFNTQPNTTAARAWMEAEVLRKETQP